MSSGSPSRIRTVQPESAYTGVRSSSAVSGLTIYQRHSPVVAPARRVLGIVRGDLFLGTSPHAGASRFASGEFSAFATDSTCRRLPLGGRSVERRSRARGAPIDHHAPRVAGGGAVPDGSSDARGNGGAPLRAGSRAGRPGPGAARRGAARPSRSTRCPTPAHGAVSPGRPGLPLHRGRQRAGERNGADEPPTPVGTPAPPRTPRPPARPPPSAGRPPRPAPAPRR